MIRLGEALKEHNQDWYNGFIELVNGVNGVVRLENGLINLD